MTALRTPHKTTLRKYGLTEEEWNRIADSQNRVCFVCEKVPASGILHIDHEHVKGWKGMPPAFKRRYVRGLLCWHCNSVWLRRGATVVKLQRAAQYLKRYEDDRERAMYRALVANPADFIAREYLEPRLDKETLDLIS